MVSVPPKQEKLTFFLPKIVDDMLHAIIKESMLEARTEHAYGVVVKFFGPLPSKSNLHKLAMLKYEVKAPFKFKEFSYEYRLDLKARLDFHKVMEKPQDWYDTKLMFMKSGRFH